MFAHACRRFAGAPAFAVALLISLTFCSLLGGSASAQTVEGVEVWRHEALGIHLGAAGFEAADLDGDGSLELVMGALDHDLSDESGTSFFEPLNRYWSVVDVVDGSPPAFEVTWNSAPTGERLFRVRTLDLEGDGAAEVLVGLGSTLEVWASQAGAATRGAMVRVDQVATGAVEVRGVARADVDQDGALEWVVCDLDDVVIHDAATGAFERRLTGVGGTDLAVGDVDGDGALEIVVGGDPYEGLSGVGGHVLDAATGALEWSDDRRFGGRVAVLDIDGVDGRDEILAWGSYDYGVAAIDGVSRDQRWQSGYGYPEARDVAIADYDGDGALEVVWSDDAEWLLRILDLATGVEELSISIDDPGVLGLAVGDFAGTTAPDVVWADTAFYSIEDRLRLFEPSVDSIVAQTEDLRGPFFGLAAGDLDVDGTGVAEPHLVHTVFRGPGGWDSGRYQVRALDGSLVSTGPTDPWGGVGVWDVEVGDLDGLPGDEIAITHTLDGVYGVSARAASGQELWWRSVDQGEAQAVALGDVDADGAVEVVAAMGRDFSVGGELFVLDGATGLLERSVEGFAGAADLTLLRTGQLDGDAALEIVVAGEGGDLWIFDGATLLLESQTFGPAVTALATADPELDGFDRLYVGTADASVHEIDPVSGSIQATLGTFVGGTGGSGPIHGLDAVDGDGDGVVDLAFVAGGVPTLISVGGGVLWTGPDLGAAAGRHDGLLAGDFDGDGLAELWIHRGVLGTVLFELEAIVGTRPDVTLISPDPSAANYCYIQPWGCWVDLVGEATDAEDGWLFDQQADWSSDLQGPLGSGFNTYAELTVAGTHQIALAATDSDGNTSVATVPYQVFEENLGAPVVTIVEPADGAVFLLGEVIQVSGTAVDPEAGDLSANIDWSDGWSWLGRAASLTLDTQDLGPGIHVLSAEIYEEPFFEQASIQIEVRPDGPEVTILEPADGTTVLEREPITFRATAVDTQDGDLSAGITWSSSLEGSFATGAEATTAELQPGQHTIWAQVPDADGNAGEASITLTIEPNAVPTITIDAPADLAHFVEGDPITFTASAFDAEDGDLSSQIVWWSSSAGPLGTGASLTTTLPLGTLQMVSATVADAQGQEDVAEVRLDVVPNQPPAVSIDAPSDGASATLGEAVTFTGTALDSADGDLSAAIAWSSDRDGALGTGASLSLSSLSLGEHVVTAQVSDSLGATSTDQISFQIRPLPVTLTVVSDGLLDGWVRESSEGSGVGGKASEANASKTGLRAGDTRSDKQVKTVLSFDTSAIPDGAEVLEATLTIVRGGTRGGDPWAQPAFGALTIDVAPPGGFGVSPALEASDFEALAAATGVGTMTVAPAVDDASTGALDAAGRVAIDVTGLTQLRLAFALDDDDDQIEDQATFYAGEHGKEWRRPTLTIVYQE